MKVVNDFALDGFDFFIIGVALPFLRQDFGPEAAAAVAGSLVGALTLGAITDRVGRQRMAIYYAWRWMLGVGVAMALASAACGCKLSGQAWGSPPLLGSWRCAAVWQRPSPIDFGLKPPAKLWRHCRSWSLATSGNKGLANQ